MRWGVLIVWLVIAAAASVNATGELYKCKGDNGETVFSDQPCNGGETLPMRETPTYAPPPKPVLPTGSGETVANKKKAVVNYQVQLSEPAADAVIRDNEGKVNVEVGISPRLDEDHRVRLLLDGTPVGTPGLATSWALADVERGEHTLVVEVVHKDSGKAFGNSGARKFMLFRTSVNDATPSGDNLSVVPSRNGLVQQANWPQLKPTPQPGDPAPAVPTKPNSNGPRK